MTGETPETGHAPPTSPSPPEPAVLVVGAGPAGATAARALAMAGVTVTLLDRATFPRNKPCGGGISIRALRRFPYLNAGLARIGVHTVSRLHLEGPDGQSALIDARAPAALMIRRVEFDALLVALAVEAGAQLLTGVEIVQARQERDRIVVTARDGQTFGAPFVIAADGVNSVVARRLGLNRGWPAQSVALDMMEETPRQILRDVDPSTLWVAYGYTSSSAHPRDKVDAVVTSAPVSTPMRSAAPARGRMPEGYAYVFPKRDHVNIGVGYVLAHYRDAVGTKPYDLQRELVDTLRARGILAGESMRGNFTPFLIPVGGPLRRTGRGRVLVAGDAGGFVNAFTAEGIYYAMVSGEAAARAIVRSKGCVGQLAGDYRRSWDGEIGAELRDAVMIQQYLFADRRRIGRIMDGAHREGAIKRLIVDLVVGRRGYAAVRRGVLARAPLIAARFGWELLKSTLTSGDANA